MSANQVEEIPFSPPAGYQQVESLVPGVTVYALKPKKSESDRALSYACPHCGANTAYDVSAGGVTCEYCGYIAPTTADRVGHHAQNFEFTLETLSLARQGWGIQRQVVHCDSCGAELSITPGAITTTCAFCASNQVNILTIPEETLRPRYLVPFKISPDETASLAKDWLGKGWYHPSELAGDAVLRRFYGVYLPFWSFHAQVVADWRAQVGQQVTYQHYNANRKRFETRTRTIWKWKNGQARLNIDDFLVSGSAPRRLNHRILHRLYPFHLSDLAAYTPDFLAGWQAQAYETTLPEAWEIGKKDIRENAKKACHQQIPSSLVRNFSMSADFSNETWCYILLPIYLAAYRYKGKVYQVMINGQTGTIAGAKPVDWFKIWLAIAALLAPGIFLTLIGLPLTLIGGLGSIAIIFGFILFIFGVIISFSLYKQARNSEVP